MPLGDLFIDPADTREELMGATYQALCIHGYAALTIQRISDHFPKSKSLLYHHYDSKDELLVDFLSFILDHFEMTLSRDADETVEQQLATLLDHVLPTDPDTERIQFMCAMIELRAQAATDSEYQAQFTRSTQFFHDQFVEIIDRGIADGTFDQVDTDQVASLLVTTIEGAMLQQTTTGPEQSRETLSTVRSELDVYIEKRLMTADRGAR
jgi:AcrR family transcriptional regulator